MMMTTTIVTVVIALHDHYDSDDYDNSVTYTNCGDYDDNCDDVDCDDDDDDDYDNANG